MAHSMVISAIAVAEVRVGVLWWCSRNALTLTVEDNQIDHNPEDKYC